MATKKRLVCFRSECIDYKDGLCGNPEQNYEHKRDLMAHQKCRDYRSKTGGNICGN